MPFAWADFVNVLISVIPFPTPPRNVYDQSEQQGDEDRLQDKLLSVDVTGHDPERPVSIARKLEKTESPVRRKHRRKQDGKDDCYKCTFHRRALNHKAPWAVKRAGFADEIRPKKAVSKSNFVVVTRKVRFRDCANVEHVAPRRL